MYEGFDHCNLSTGSIITGGTVSEGNCTISVVRPGGRGRRRGGEGVGRETNNPEERILVTNAHRPEELLDVIDSVERMTSGPHEDASEAGHVSGSRLSDLVETEA